MLWWHEAIHVNVAVFSEFFGEFWCEYVMDSLGEVPQGIRQCRLEDEQQRKVKFGWRTSRSIRNCRYSGALMRSTMNYPHRIRVWKSIVGEVSCLFVDLVEHIALASRNVSDMNVFLPVRRQTSVTAITSLRNHSNGRLDNSSSWEWNANVQDRSIQSDPCSDHPFPLFYDLGVITPIQSRVVPCPCLNRTFLVALVCSFAVPRPQSISQSRTEA